MNPTVAVLRCLFCVTPAFIKYQCIVLHCIQVFFITPLNRDVGPQRCLYQSPEGPNLYLIKNLDPTLAGSMTNVVLYG